MMALVVGWVGECCSGLNTRVAIPQSNTEDFKQNTLKIFRDAYSFQFGMQMSTWGEKWSYYGKVG